MRHFSIIVLIALLIVPGAAFAEVSDKAATVPQIWAQNIVLGLAALLAGRYRFLLGVALLPFSLFLTWAGYTMLADPHFGPALGAPAYKFAVCGGAVALFVLHGIGLYLGWRRGGLLGGESRAA